MHVSWGHFGNVKAAFAVKINRVCYLTPQCTFGYVFKNKKIKVEEMIWLHEATGLAN